MAGSSWRSAIIRPASRPSLAKDVQLALNAAKDLQVPMPMASLISDRFLTIIAGGGGALAWSALGLLAKRDAGESPTLMPPK
jgi:hypothetical protein